MSDSTVEPRKAVADHLSDGRVWLRLAHTFEAPQNIRLLI